jgi:hypothetical protein
MFRKLRILVLLYILAFAAIGNYLATARSTDWNDPLWVDVYPVNADGSARTQAYIDGLADGDFAEIERYFSREARRFGVAIDTPFRVVLAPQVTEPVPTLPESAGMLDTVVWSMKMRWFAIRTRRANGRPAPDIQLFALYHDAVATDVLDRSTALQHGLIAVTKVFASRDAARANQVVMAHELLHTLGATDKYAPASNLPAFPYGYADPSASPLLPQTRAELMAGRIPISQNSAAIPATLDQTLIGPLTATEIRWLALD